MPIFSLRWFIVLCFIILFISKCQSQPTTRPTSQPSCWPSSQPSTQPSAQPSIPTSEPSSKPSCQPSLQPTSEPSAQPSCIPSSQPSSVPSLQPSSQPSSRPTTYEQEVVTLSAVTTLTGITAFFFETSSSTQFAFKIALAQNMRGISVDQITISTATSTSTYSSMQIVSSLSSLFRRNLYLIFTDDVISSIIDTNKVRVGGRMLSPTDVAKIPWSCSYNVQSLGYADASASIAAISSQITSAVNDGSFVASMLSVDSSLSSFNLAASISTIASVIDVTRSYAPTPGPMTKPKFRLSRAAIIGISFSASFTGCILLCCCYCAVYRFVEKTKEGWVNERDKLEERQRIANEKLEKKFGNSINKKAPNPVADKFRKQAKARNENITSNLDSAAPGSGEGKNRGRSPNQRFRANGNGATGNVAMVKRGYSSVRNLNIGNDGDENDGDGDDDFNDDNDIERGVGRNGSGRKIATPSQAAGGGSPQRGVYAALNKQRSSGAINEHDSEQLKMRKGTNERMQNLSDSELQQQVKSLSATNLELRQLSSLPARPQATRMTEITSASKLSMAQRKAMEAIATDLKIDNEKLSQRKKDDTSPNNAAMSSPGGAGAGAGRGVRGASSSNLGRPGMSTSPSRGGSTDRPMFSSPFQDKDKDTSAEQSLPSPPSSSRPGDGLLGARPPMTLGGRSGLGLGGRGGRTLGGGRGGGGGADGGRGRGGSGSEIDERGGGGGRGRVPTTTTASSSRNLASPASPTLPPSPLRRGQSSL